MQRVLITGANRGIGLEFVRQYLERGDTVIAAVRDMQRASGLAAMQHRYSNALSLTTLDVVDQASIGAAFHVVQSQADRLDVLINNAGIFYSGDRPGTITRDRLRNAFEVNTIGPLMVVQTFLPLLRTAGGAKVVNLSSNMGSIENSRGGGSYSYRASKAALNMVSRVLSGDLRAMNIAVIAMNPGWVQTDMGGDGAPLPVDASVRGMIAVIDGLAMSESGSFYQWDGKKLPW
jgi:NAD(P)-dependent dehydrogenase (short-subunit alcohol dehydrogenase family)